MMRWTIIMLLLTITLLTSTRQQVNDIKISQDNHVTIGPDTKTAVLTFDDDDDDNNNNDNNCTEPNRDESNTKTDVGNLLANKENESAIPTSWGDASESRSNRVRARDEQQMQRDADAAADVGLRALHELVQVKEPEWHRMGLVLDDNDPAKRAALFGAPSRRAAQLVEFGFATSEAAKHIAKLHSGNVGRQDIDVESALFLDGCPFKGVPRCTRASRRYRTADGTCNHPQRPWRGSASLPMQRFLPPVYDDGIQSVRRSTVGGEELPSARDISARIHRDHHNQEQPMVTLMFVQWGQFVDHDLTATVKSRSFNGSIPRCCNLPSDLTHPSCLPIPVSPQDEFFARLGVDCLEFVRSAPSTRINCRLGWREQINQVTSFLDASVVYGSDVETSDSLRTFRGGKLQYGRDPQQGPLRPPDPVEGELCRTGALASECFQSGDGRMNEQVGLTAIHTVFLRYHNKLATILGQINAHWSDEQIFQETRRIIGALIQHITFREFLPILLGEEVIKLFEIELSKKGYYEGYDKRVNPSISNSFSTAAFRFGHSMVQSSFVRADINHRPLFNNVSLHQEQDNIVNIWSLGSLDRLVLGMSNQLSQRRDEFISDELTNHLFQTSGFAFGMDLAAINIQRGRDHGLPSYTSWRMPCGLSPVTLWSDLTEIMALETVENLRFLYRHVDDIDLFTGGLAERPVRGGIVGPTFACIIAQQFLILRKGDRFWYENGGFGSSFTPAQLQQLRHVSLAQIICKTLTEIETIQPFVFLAPGGSINNRLDCRDQLINNFDLSPWVEIHLNDVNSNFSEETTFEGRSKTKPKTKPKATTQPVRNKQSFGDEIRPYNDDDDDETYLYGTVTEKNEKRFSEKHTFDGRAKTKLKTKPEATTQAVRNKQSYGDEIRPNRRPYDDHDDDGTYLYGTVNKKTEKPPTPIEVNIKIQYYLPTSTTKRPKKKKRPTQTKSSTVKTPESYNYPIFLQNGYQGASSNSKPYSGLSLNGRPNFQSQNGYSDDFSVRPTTKRPYVIQHDHNYAYNDERTSKRPYIYRPDSNLYIYSQPYPTRRPNFPKLQDQPQKRPTLGYNRDDDDFYDYIPKKPTFGQIDDRISDIPQVNIDDKLDFRTRFGTGQTSSENKKFIKISSVRAQVISSKDANVQFQVAQREGELELGDLGDDDDDDDVRLVNLEVTPSEVGRWMIFNTTTDDTDTLLLQVPDHNGPSSSELPKPINMTKTFDTERQH